MPTPLDDLLSGVMTPAVASGKVLTTVTRIVKPVLDLYDYQTEAVEFALRNQGKGLDGLPTYLALDRGLGKSPVGATIAASIRAARADKPVLIVVPPSLRTMWTRELHKFQPHLMVGVIDGATFKGTDALRWTPPASADVLLMGDSQVTGWSEALAGKVDDFIIDECHRFKNKSGRTKSMQVIADQCSGLKVIMSGTPLPNGRHSELDQQVSIMGTKAWSDIGGKGVFYTKYAPIVDARYGSRSSENRKDLHDAMTKTWFFRRLRGDVLDLPNKGRTAMTVDATGKAKRDYIRAEDDLIQWLAEEGMNWKNAARAEALVRLTTLRKLAGASKVEGVVAHVKDILESLGDTGGVFVVAEHRDVMEALMTGLDIKGVNPVAVKGGMSDRAKTEAVDAFNSGKSRVMVGQIIAAGVGLTLHGNGINHNVVIAQLPWTPADLLQAEDRLHRIGQTNDVEIEICMAAIEGRWTIDERLWGQLEAKAFNAGEVTDGEAEVLLEDIQGGVLDSYR